MANIVRFIELTSMGKSTHHQPILGRIRLSKYFLTSTECVSTSSSRQTCPSAQSIPLHWVQAPNARSGATHSGDVLHAGSRRKFQVVPVRLSPHPRSAAHLV